MPPIRCSQNPLFSPQDIPPHYPEHEVIGVFNAGVAQLASQVILLLRIAERPIQTSSQTILTSVYHSTEDRLEVLTFDKDCPQVDCSDKRLIVTPDRTYLTSLSYLRVARSCDGVNFDLDPGIFLGPYTPYEVFGLEDPRITLIDGVYYIQYVAVSPYGVVTCLAKTKDFYKVDRMGIIFGPENKDVAIFSGSIEGKYFALHRPTSPFSLKNEVWLAGSPDLVAWGEHQYLVGLREGGWDSVKIGAGAPPLQTPSGWLAVYHGANAENRYCLGALLLDSKEPWRVLARSNEPILAPEADYECSGFFGQVVFTCGVVLEYERLKIYYGASDSKVALAEIGLDDVFASF